MPVSTCVALSFLVSASITLAEPPLVEPVQEAKAHHPDPANYMFCKWASEPHTHGEAVPRGGVPGNTTTLIHYGSSSNRIDLVIVGDGYTPADLTTYAAHALNGVNDLFATPPFDVYQELFNVHRVDVISNESGVDNDPDQGINRDTALDMGFWCGGTERALCQRWPRHQRRTKRTRLGPGLRHRELEQVRRRRLPRKRRWHLRRRQRLRTAGRHTRTRPRPRQPRRRIHL